MLRHDLYVCGEPADASFVHALTAKLAALGWRVHDALAAPEPGTDPGKARAEALEHSAWFVVVVGQRRDPELRAQILAVVEARKTDPHGARVIPVRLPGRRLDAAWDTLPLLQAIETEEPDEAAARIHAVADKQGLRAWGQTKARVAVIAVMAELTEHAKRAADLLKGLKSQVAEVVEVDLMDPGALARAEGCLLRLVLLGGSTAGAEGAALVEGLLKQGDRTLLATLDPVPNEVQKRFRSDYGGRMDLLDLVPQPLHFANPGDIPGLRDDIATRLAALLPEPAQGKVVLEPWERWYLSSQDRSWEEGRAGGLRAMSQRCRLERAPLYVSLHARPGRWERVADGQVHLLSHQRPDRPKEKPAPIFLDELISHPQLRHLVVVGEAGTGKTVLLQHVAWSLCLHHRGEPLPEECRLDLDALAKDQPAVPVPVLIEARTLAAEIRVHGRPGAIERLLARTFCADEAPPDRRPPPGAVAQGLDQGRYLLLVDALDEVPGQTAREDVLDLLKGLPRASRCRVVLSTRPTAHTNVSVPAAYQRVDIAPLDQERRDALLARWRAVQGLDEEATRALPRALSGLGARFRGDGAGAGRSPLDNPLLLTAVLLVHLEQRRLPDNLADLYERMVRHLCDRRPDDPEAQDDQRDRTSAERRELLMRVGFALQEAGSTALSVDRLAERLVAEGRARDRAEARAALDRLSVSTGLIRFEDERREQVVRPWHRSFQEYLAACSLAGRKGSEAEVVADLAKARPDGPAPLMDPGWEGCLRFATGAFGQTGGARARGYVEALLAEAERCPIPQCEGRLLGLAAAGVAEYAREYFREGTLLKELPERVAERFLAADGAWPWRDRLLALTALGRLGDPRLPDLRTSSEGWVEVPGPNGAAPFKLRAWPVTVAEYAAFVEDSAFSDPTWWTESEPSEPELWDEQIHIPNAPVVGVSWYDARAFCRWANARWTRPAPEGSFDLPDSQEWEAAATMRGGPYPWGRAEPARGDGAQANYGWGRDFPSDVTPVGLFRREADGPFLDLAGNVWEWCGSGLSVTGDTRCHLDDKVDDKPRVLRGCSWFSDSRLLRAALRDRDDPRSRDGYIGFRVVFRRPPASVLEP